MEVLPSLYSDRQTVIGVSGFRLRNLSGSDEKSLSDRPNSWLYKWLFARSGLAGIGSIELRSCSRSKACKFSPDDLTTQEF